MRVLLIVATLLVFAVVSSCSSTTTSLNEKQASTAYTFVVSGSITWNTINTPIDQHITIVMEHPDPNVPDFTYIDNPPSYLHSQDMEEGVWKVTAYRDGFDVTPTWTGAPYLNVYGPDAVAALNFVVTDW